MGIDPVPACPPCVTVLPNTFLDGLSGVEVKVGYNGEPRIKCVSGGEFQVAQPVFGGCPGGCRPVGANGFTIAIGTFPPNGPEEMKILPAGALWPPATWPTVANQPSEFQPGIPTVIPPWAVVLPPAGTAPPSLPTPTSSEDRSTFMARCQGVLTNEPDELDATAASAWCQYAWSSSTMTLSAPPASFEASAEPSGSHRPPERTPRRRR